MESLKPGYLTVKHLLALTMIMILLPLILLSQGLLRFLSAGSSEPEGAKCRDARLCYACVDFAE